MSRKAVRAAPASGNRGAPIRRNRSRMPPASAPPSSRASRKQNSWKARRSGRVRAVSEKLSHWSRNKVPASRASATG